MFGAVITADVVRESDPMNNIPDSIFSKLGLQLHWRDHHPIRILKNTIYDYFDTNYPNSFLKFDDLCPIVPVKAKVGKRSVPSYKYIPLKRGLKRRSIDFSVRPVPSCFSDRVWSKISLRTTATTVPSKADPMAISGPESQSQPQPPVVNMVSTTTGQTEVEFAKCDCCGLTEECTPAYVTRIRERHQGRWVCGLCSEAVKEEIRRSAERLIGMDEALTRHMSFCNKVSSAVPVNPTVHLISAMRQVLRRSLDSPRFMSESCFSTLTN
ncbi:hypothetical protein AAC387_Pa02g5202 [Persea americana]